VYLEYVAIKTEKVVQYANHIMLYCKYNCATENNINKYIIYDIGILSMNDIMTVSILIF